MEGTEEKARREEQIEGIRERIGEGKEEKTRREERIEGIRETIEGEEEKAR